MESTISRSGASSSRCPRIAPRSDSAARYSSSRNAPVRSARSRTCPADSSPVTYRTRVPRLRRHLQQQRRLPDARLARQQHDRAGDESAAEHAVQFGHAGRPGPGGVELDIGDAAGGRGRRARGDPGARRARRRGLDERAPRLARRAAPHPLGRPVLAGRAAVGRAGAGGHSAGRARSRRGCRPGPARVTSPARWNVSTTGYVGPAFMSSLSPVSTTWAAWCSARRARGARLPRLQAGGAGLPLADGRSGGRRCRRARGRGRAERADGVAGRCRRGLRGRLRRARRGDRRPPRVAPDEQ